MCPNDHNAQRDQNTTEALRPDELDIWVADQAAPDSNPAMMIYAVRMQGPLDEMVLRRAVAGLATLHRAVRVMIEVRSGEPHKRYAEPGDVPVFVDDLPDDISSPETWLQDRLTEVATYRIDLTSAPGLAVRVLRLAPNDWTLCLHINHICSDDLTVWLLMRDFGRCYAAALSDADCATPDNETSLDKHSANRTPAVRVASSPRPSPLPWPGRQLHNGHAPKAATVSFVHEDTLSKEMVEDLRRIARDSGVTLYCLVAATYQILLGRYCMADEVGVGIGISTRANPAAMNEVGNWVNYTGLAQSTGDPVFVSELAGRFCRDLRALREGKSEQTLTSFSASIVQYLKERNLPSIPGITATHVKLPAECVLVELTASLRLEGEGAIIVLRGRKTLFTETDLEALMAAWLGLLKELTGRDRIANESLPLPAETRRAIARRSSMDLLPETILDPAAQFDRVVSSTPDAIALRGEANTITYAELDEQARRLAAWLLGPAGVVPGDRIAMMLDRGPDLAIAHLAALLAGVVIVPIDVSYPDERVALVLSRADCRLILADDPAQRARLARLAKATESVKALPPRAEIPEQLPRDRVIAPDAPAYVIYTSGSTGAPKGTVIPRQAIARLIVSCFSPRPKPGDNIGQLASPGFDALFIELWGALLNGAALVCPSAAPQTVMDYSDLLRRFGITHQFFTTSVFNLLVDEAIDALGGLRDVRIGGEAISPKHATAFVERFPKSVLSNVYGPTENGALSTAFRIDTPPPSTATSLPIGRPLPGNMAFVLDQNLALVPDGFLGELWLGGPGLALGYDGDEDMTAERFIDFAPAALSLDGVELVRLYRTGDKVRWDAAGNELEFHGRIDSQIKFNGQRIEPTEVEAVMQRVRGVRRAAVIPLHGGPGGAVSGLVGVYDCDRSGMDQLDMQNRIRRALSQALPRYLHPTRLQHFPDGLALNSSGKIDRIGLRRALFDIEAETKASFTDVPNADGIAVALFDLWCETLRCKTAGREDNFFDAGGHSVLAMRFLSKLERTLGLVVSLDEFLKDPRLGALQARMLQPARRPVPLSDHLTLLKAGSVTTAPIFCLPGILGQAGWVFNALKVMPDMGRQILGLQATYLPNLLSIDEIAEVFADEIIKWHKAHGIDQGAILLGFSIAGFMAGAVAAKLEAAGHAPSQVIMFDPGSTLFPRHTSITGGDQGMTDTLEMMRMAHDLAPINTRLDFVFATRGFPWPNSVSPEEWAILARGGVAVYPVEEFHMTLCEAQKGKVLAGFVDDLVAKRLLPTQILDVAWSTDELAAVAEAGRLVRTGNHAKARRVLAGMPEKRRSHPALVQQIQWLDTQLKDIGVLSRSAAALMRNNLNADAASTLALMDALQSVGAPKIADQLDETVLDIIADPTPGTVFRRVKRWLQRGRKDRATRLALDPDFLEQDAVEVAMVQLLLFRASDQLSHEEFAERLVAVLSESSAAPPHFLASFRDILTPGDQELAVRITALAKMRFPRDPFLATLEEIWERRSST